MGRRERNFVRRLTFVMQLLIYGGIGDNSRSGVTIADGPAGRSFSQPRLREENFRSPFRDERVTADEDRDPQSYTCTSFIHNTTCLPDTSLSSPVPPPLPPLPSFTAASEGTRSGGENAGQGLNVRRAEHAAASASVRQMTPILGSIPR